MHDAVIRRVSGVRMTYLFAFWLTVDRHTYKGHAMTSLTK